MVEGVGRGAGGGGGGGGGRGIEVKEVSKSVPPAQGATEVSRRRMEEGPGRG